MLSTYRSRYGTLILPLTLLLITTTAFAQGTSFSYQGRLTDSGNPAAGTFDMQFKLFDTQTVGTGTQHGLTIPNPFVQVENGVFSVTLDFYACADCCPSCFDGSARFLEISIRPAGSADPYTVLGPRQAITPAPYAVRALDATQLGGQPASGFIQNNTTVQAETNFNISGDGIAGGQLSASIVNAATQYRINGNRVLSVSGLDNTFVGVEAGASNTGSKNTFLGAFAGFSNSGGGGNSFFGASAGSSNTIGGGNSFFGREAGLFHTSGGSNSYFGALAGRASTIGSFNSFFGSSAGLNNSTGTSNSFYGASAGQNNSTGNFNSFFGASAGAGSNITGSFNTIIGSGSSLASPDLSHATAIGSGVVVASSDTVVIGRSNDSVQVPGMVVINTLGASGGIKLCLNASNQVSNCSESQQSGNSQPFARGLDLIEKLRPIRFDLRGLDKQELGLGAGEVATIEPMLVTYDEKGRVEGVKYERITIVLINAIKEQQNLIEQKESQIDALKQQNAQFEARLKALEERLQADKSRRVKRGR